MSEESLYYAWREARLNGSEADVATATRNLAIGLHRFARKILWHKLDWDERDIGYDLADLAVTDAISNLDKFAGKSKFTTYFYGIVLHKYHDYMRDITRDPFKRQAGVNLDDLTAHLGYDPWPRVNAELMVDQLRKRLSPKDQRLLNAWLMGFDQREAEIEKVIPLRQGKRPGRKKDLWRRLFKQLRKLAVEKPSSKSLAKSAV